MTEQNIADMEKEKRKIKSVARMKEIMTTYYIEAKTAAEAGKKVAWITSGGPVEFLIAMDVIPVYPENHGAMIGAAKMGVDLCERAEEMGYSRDLCSYARSDIAAAVTSGGPIGGLPRPDFLVCCNNICGTVLKWYEVMARYFNVPLFVLDTPFIHTRFSDAAKKYVIYRLPGSPDRQEDGFRPNERGQYAGRGRASALAGNSGYCGTQARAHDRF